MFVGLDDGIQFGHWALSGVEKVWTPTADDEGQIDAAGSKAR
jgi:hypothetical protein